MPLTPGSRLGTYEVLVKLGEGGMGEVYRARDTRLGRDVALKILPEPFATDPDRLMRFEREARTLASLNHPHIANIYGLEETAAVGVGRAGALALVMELVEGEDLNVRIARGAIPLDEALPIARQIAEALEAAHEIGIIHRDLKPANIKLRRDGTVKVLDFGLAKALGAFDVDRNTSAGNGPSAQGGMPTVTSPAMTLRGLILGTAAYMSPEQAKGKPVDKRADIWAFGAVLYEMLTGRRAFEGEDVSDTLASVLRADPDYSALSADVPGALRSIIRRCLTRDVRQRARDIGDIRIQLDELRDGSGTVEPPNAAAASTTQAASRWPLAVAAIALVATAGLVAWSRPKPITAVLFRGTVDLEIPGQVWTRMGPGAIISPDGTTVVVTVDEPGKPNRLYVRRLDQYAATVVSGAEGARNPFFSRDGQWLGFFADGKLKKIALTGGAAMALADAPEDRGGTWTDDGDIVFAPTGRSPLRRVSANGGAVENVTELIAGDNGHRFPKMLPGGRGVIYSLMTDVGTQSIVVQPLDGGARKVLQEQAFFPHYLASGHVAFLRDGTVYAGLFDVQTLAFATPPVPVLEGVKYGNGPGAGQAAFSDSGPAVYVRGGVSTGVEMVWLSPDGVERSIGARLANYRDPRLSPDGRKVAVTVQTGSGDIWVHDLKRGTMSRVTFEGSNEIDPLWSIDGEHITFGVVEPGLPSTVYLKRADGTGTAQMLLRSEQNQNVIPFSWHPSGRALASIRQQPAGGADVIVTEFTGDAKTGLTAGQTVAFSTSPFTETEPAFSPDGKWLAYQSNETGRNEVYVSGYPGPAGRWQVSTSGGLFPTWGRDGRTLYFKAPDQQLMTATYSSTRGAFEVSGPRAWSPARLDDLGLVVRTFDVHPDGRMLALRAPADEGSATVKFTLIPDFIAQLRRLAPGGR